MSPGPTFGPYPTSGVLGSGGMGVVYLARDPKLGRELAIKTLSAGGGADETQRRRFQREARALAELSHPGLVSIVDAGVQDGMPWLAMVRVPGESLESVIRARGRLSSQEVCALGVQLCSALAVAHSRGILHRDLKPENVLVTPDGRYVITDFGLTKDLVGEVSGDLSQTGALIGTPGFWAPEQAMGQSGLATPATDVYGLGALLYAALTGVPPISASSLLEAVVATRERPPTPPSALATVSPGLEKIVLKCLEKSPKDRYDSVDILEEALRELSRGQARRAGGSRVFLAAGAAGAFLSGVLGVWFATGRTPPEIPVASRPSPEPARETPAAGASTPAQGLAQDPESRVRRALESRAWEEGHQALGQAAGLDALWLRYLLLRAELEREGTASETWRERKEEALAAADLVAAGADSTPSAAWSRALQGLIGLLKDPFVGFQPGSGPQHISWRVALQRALEEGALEEERTLALRQGLATAALHEAAREPPGGPAAAERARAQISAWEAAGAPRWKVAFLRARLELLVGERPQEFVSAVDELADEAIRTQRPWLLATSTFFRGELTLGFARRDLIPLWRSLSADLACPPVMRGHVANRLGALLLEAGKWVQALQVLLQAPPLPTGALGGVRHDRILLTAWAQLRCGRPKAALEELAERPAGGRKPARYHLLRGIALAHLGKLEESRAEAGGAAAGLRGDRILLVEQVALTAKPGEVEGLLRRVVNGAKPVQALLCADRIEELTSAPSLQGRAWLPESEPLLRFVAALREEQFSSLEEVVAAHLKDGLWRLAARRVEQALGEERARAVLRARLDYQILSRGLEEVRPGEAGYRALFTRALTLATRNLDETQPHSALVSALLSLGPEPWRGSVTQLGRGLTAHPDWSELHDAVDRVFRGRASQEGAPRSVLFGAMQNVRAWLTTHPDDVRAVSARAHWAPPAVRRRVLKTQGVIADARALARLERARVDGREQSPGKGSDSLSYVGHSRQLLTRSRAEVFLDAAETRLRVFEGEAKALRVLDLIRAWCGAELGDPARYHLLRARALLGLGRAREALVSARRAEVAARGRGPELRGRALAILGRCELTLDPDLAEGRLRLRQASELAPCFEVWLAAARSARSSEEAERCYGEAFSHLEDAGQITPLWDEVLRASLSASRVARYALRHFEGRGPSVFRVLVASSLFARQGDAECARVLCRAVLHKRISGGSSRAVAEVSSAELQRALKLLPPRLQALVISIEEALAAAEAWEEQRSEQGGVDLKAALDRLVQVSNGVDAQAANDFWLPAVFEFSGGVLLRWVSPEQARSARRRELEAARRARGAREPSLRLEFWIARLEISLQDPKALETLGRALAVAKGYTDQRLIVQLERGLLLRRLGREEDALEAYDDMIYTSEQIHWKVLGLSLKAQILRRQGPKGREQQILELGRAQSLGSIAVPSNVQTLHVLALARAHLDARDLKRARLALEAADKELAKHSSPALISERKLLGVTLARLSGRLNEALRLADLAARGGPSASGVREERALILVALGRRSEAIAFLERELEASEALWPGLRADLEELLEELAEDAR